MKAPIFIEYDLIVYWLCEDTVYAQMHKYAFLTFKSSSYKST